MVVALLRSGMVKRVFAMHVPWSSNGCLKWTSNPASFRLMLKRNMQMQTWGCSKENWHGNEKWWFPIEIETFFSKGALPLFSGYMFVLGGVISVNVDDVSYALRLITHLTQKSIDNSWLIIAPSAFPGESHGLQEMHYFMGISRSQNSKM